MNETKELPVRRVWGAIILADLSFLTFVIRLLISIFTKNFSNEILMILFISALLCLIPTYYVIHAFESCDRT